MISLYVAESERVTRVTAMLCLAITEDHDKRGGFSGSALCRFSHDLGRRVWLQQTDARAEHCLPEDGAMRDACLLEWEDLAH